MLVIAVTIFANDEWDDSERPTPVPMIAKTQGEAVALIIQYFREAYEPECWLDEPPIAELEACKTYDELKKWLGEYYDSLSVTYNEVDL